MAGIISESYTSRQFSVGIKSSSRELVYDIVNTTDEAEVGTLIAGASPTIYGGLIRDSIEAEPVGIDETTGMGIWRGRARYISPEVEQSFDSGGGTQKITQSLATVNAYAPVGFVAPNYQGAIGVSNDRVEGVDIVIPKFDFSETHIWPDSVVTTTYKLALFNLTGRTNVAKFRGFEIGEVLFLGSTGTFRGSDQWAITYKFSCSPNVTGLTIGDITDIDKAGWDYLWIRYAEFHDDMAYAIVPRPIAVYVEQVYLSGDFSTLAIGTD